MRRIAATTGALVVSAAVLPAMSAAATTHASGFTPSLGGAHATASSGTSPSQGAAVAAFARAQLGKPYAFGASGPNAYDCSGLATAAYRSIGRTLPRTTWGQATVGTPVSLHQAQEGDLVLTSPEHVGIYIGSRQIIHAPRPGQNVQVSHIWSVHTIRRV